VYVRVCVCVCVCLNLCVSVCMSMVCAVWMDVLKIITVVGNRCVL
jgi:hypothetical protein